MKKQIITTSDGTKTIHFPEWKESYHSKHGALQEAKHVYIKSGLAFCLENMQSNSVKILEVGFGTGLNAILSIIFAEKYNTIINYTCVEKYPLEEEIVENLDYSAVFPDQATEFGRIHSCDWEEFENITSNFKLKKLQADLKTFKSNAEFDVIFFDAFGPRVQPELWSKPILQNMYSALKQGGIWVTYSCKGQVRRDLIEVGYKVEKIPGPPGKREMLRAIKV